MSQKLPPGQYIAIICILGAIGVSVYTFAASRLDPGLRMAALVSMTNLAAALMATASTMLVGKTFGPEKPNPSDLPPGSITTSNETVQTPPITLGAEPTEVSK
jgi:hypothetical protein